MNEEIKKKLEAMAMSDSRGAGMKHIISYSGGLGSFSAAKMTIDKYGVENCVAIFTDTKTEDEDLYRFLNQSTSALGIELIKLCDGRDIWGVFSDVKFMCNSRIDPCSRVLKRDLFRRYIDDNYKPDSCVIIFGIDHKESHRMVNITDRWKPYNTVAPLCEKQVSRETILNWLDDIGVAPPRLYEYGFIHNNCGGFCVKTGQKQMALLLSKMPDRYKFHEEQQEKLFAIIGARRGFIRRVENGETMYLGLKEFREFLESGGRPDLYVQDGCGCFA